MPEPHGESPTNGKKAWPMLGDELLWTILDDSAQAWLLAQGKGRCRYNSALRALVGGVGDQERWFSLADLLASPDDERLREALLTGERKSLYPMALRKSTGGQEVVGLELHPLGGGVALVKVVPLKGRVASLVPSQALEFLAELYPLVAWVGGDGKLDQVSMSASLEPLFPGQSARTVLQPGSPLGTALAGPLAHGMRMMEDGSGILRLHLPTKLEGARKFFDGRLIGMGLDADGAPQAVLTLWENTDRYRGRLRFREVSQHLRGLSELVPQYVLEVSKWGRLLHANSQLLNRLGMAPTELGNGKYLNQIFAEAQLDLLEQRVWAVASAKDQRPFRLALGRAPDAQPVTCRLMLWRKDGVYSGFTLVMQAEREEALDQARLQQRAEAAERENFAKSALLANLSAELGEPLDALLALAELMAQENQPEAREKLLDLMATHGCNIRNMTTDLQDLAKIEQRDIRLKLRWVKVFPLLEQLMEHLARQCRLAHKEHIKLRLGKGEADSSFQIHTDPARLEQVLRIFLDNAVRFTSSGQIALSVELDAESVVFTVSDSGVGIAAKKQPYLFLPEELGSPASTAQANGLGLGLAVADRMVKLLGGRVWAESDSGKGASFHVRLPLVAQPSLSSIQWTQKPPPADLPLLAGKRVLVVECQEVDFRYIQVMLLKTQAKVLLAKNSREALALFKEKEPHLVLVDQELFERESLPLAQWLRGANPRVPLVAMTAFGLDEENARELHLLYDDNLSKPLRKGHLTHVLRKHILEKVASR